MSHCSVCPMTVTKLGDLNMTKQGKMNTHTHVQFYINILRNKIMDISKYIGGGGSYVSRKGSKVPREDIKPPLKYTTTEKVRYRVIIRDK